MGGGGAGHVRACAAPARAPSLPTPPPPPTHTPPTHTGHAWYKLLDRHISPEAPRSTRAVLLKTAADQLVWAPAMTLVFFAFLKTLEGHPELILSYIQERFVRTGE